MTALNLAPAPGAAPLGRMVRAQALVETRLLLRSGEQLVLAVVLPLLALVAGARSGGLVDLGAGRPIDVVAPGVLALAVLSTAFTSLAIATGFERRAGVLKRLGATPLPRSGLLAGKALAVVGVEALQVLLIGATAFALGWQPSLDAATLVAGLVVLALGTACFASLGLALAGVLRAEATLAVANLVYLLLLVGGAVVVPLARHPARLQPYLELLPSTALAQALRSLSAGDAAPAGALLVLAGWTGLGMVLAGRTFRWE
jgi:ABC-2 type transport system permease protein